MENSFGLCCRSADTDGGIFDGSYGSLLPDWAVWECVLPAAPGLPGAGPLLPPAHRHGPRGGLLQHSAVQNTSQYKPSRSGGSWPDSAPRSGLTWPAILARLRPLPYLVDSLVSPSRAAYSAMTATVSQLRPSRLALPRLTVANISHLAVGTVVT